MNVCVVRPLLHITLGVFEQKTGYFRGHLLTGMLAPKPGVGGIGGMKSSLMIAGMRTQHMAPDSAQHMWTQLDVAIHQIFTQQTSSLSFNQLYNYGYQLVIHKHGHLVYEGVANSVRQHLQSKALVVLAAANETLLQSIKAIWEEFKLMSNNLHDILMYVDKNYAKAHKPKPLPVFLTMAVQIFREVIVLNSEVQGRFRQILLEEVHKERQGQLIDRELMKAVLHMLTEMGPDGTDVYEDFFEQHFLSATRSYYKQLSQEYLALNTCQDYMRMAEARLSEEAERVSSYVSAASEQKLKLVVQQELVMTHAKTLIEMEASGCMAMFNDNKTEDLKRMYTLFLPMPQALDLLRDFMFGYVRQLGHMIVTDQETTRDPLVFVRHMLDLKSKMDYVITTSFRGEKRAQKKLKEAFEDFVNKDTRCAQHIASYVDDLLKGGLRECTEEAADEQLDRVIVLFRYLTDKDVFESFYKQHLSKRLLGGKSVSDELEKSMIAKLKVECGYQFTTKMEGMTQDMQLTRGIDDEFKRSEAYRECPIEFGLSLLRQGHWPYSTHSISIRLPEEAQRCVDIFSRDYASKNDGRKLTWMAQLGTADIKVCFTPLLPLLPLPPLLSLSAPARVLYVAHPILPPSPPPSPLEPKGNFPARPARAQRLDVSDVHPHVLQPRPRPGPRPRSHIPRAHGHPRSRGLQRLAAARARPLQP